MERDLTSTGSPSAVLRVGWDFWGFDRGDEGRNGGRVISTCGIIRLTAKNNSATASKMATSRDLVIGRGGMAGFQGGVTRMT